LPRTLINLLDNAALVFELIDRILQLLIENDAIRHDNDAIEHAFIHFVMEGRQPMREPADRVALAASGGVFDEIIVSYAFPPR